VRLSCHSLHLGSVSLGTEPKPTFIRYSVIALRSRAESFGKKATASNAVRDQDFHIVIADPNKANNQMIMEVPDPQCEAVCSSKFLAQISQLRKEVFSRLGTPSDTVQPLSTPWLVEITGPAFLTSRTGRMAWRKTA